MHDIHYLILTKLKKKNTMENKVINYRGASTTVNEVLASNSQRSDALQAKNPELNYRGAQSSLASISEVNQKHSDAIRAHDPVISYRGSTAKYSDIHG